MVSGVGVYLILNKEKSSLNRNMIEEIADKVSVLLSRRRSDEKEEKAANAVSVEKPKITASADQPSESDTSDAAEEILAADSLIVDTLTVSSDENIVVKKDELIEARTVEVVDLTPDINRKTKSDSILEAVSGIKSEKKTNERIQLMVEFWRSPINYKGYKLGKSKLILFGIDNSSQIMLYKMNGNLYLKVDQNVFALQSSDVFKSFERISDVNLLTLFNRS